MITALVGAAVLAGAAPSPALDALGLGALHWGEAADQIGRAALVWRPDTDEHAPNTLLTPGRQALVALGGCTFAVRFTGMHGRLTHVELDLSRGVRDACAQEVVSRITSALGSPRPPGDAHSTYAVQEPFWDGVGEHVGMIEWGPPIDGLGIGATADDDETVTVR